MLLQKIGATKITKNKKALINPAAVEAGQWLTVASQ